MKLSRNLLLFVLIGAVGIPALGVLSFLVRPQGQIRLASSAMMLPETQTSQTASGPMMARSLSDKSVGAPMMGYVGPNTPGFVPGADRAVVKTANIGLVVEDTTKAIAQITQLAKDAKGLVSSLNVYDQQVLNKGTQGVMVLRVPVDSLEAVVTKIKSFGSKVTQESISAEDQTKQKVDLTARVKNLQASEQQLLQIMKQAKNVQETLEVQQQLTQVREQIEVTSAELENLSGDAAMSSITVTFATKEASLPTVSDADNSILDEIKLAFKQMLRLYRSFFIEGVKITIFLAPLLVLAAIVWTVWRRRARKS